MNQPKSDNPNGAVGIAASMSYQLEITAKRVARLFAKQYETKCKISSAEWRALAVIADQGTTTPSAISAASTMDKVTVTRAVAGLANRGLVKRVLDSHDGRVYRLSLTRKGMSAHAVAEPLTREVESSLAAGMSTDDFAALWKGLKLLHERAGKLAAVSDGEDKMKRPKRSPITRKST